jgi:MFS family permease
MTSGNTSSPQRPGQQDGITLGLRQNLAQFMLLVAVNALVGGTLGQERTVLPLLAGQVFHLGLYTSALTYILAFGLAKAGTNYLAGTLSDRYGRKPVLVAGWLVAVPVPLMLIFGPSWGWIVAANVILGISQGLTWSTTVMMKMDLVGPERRGLAMGLNEAAGYLGVAGTALGTGYIASSYGLRPGPFLLGAAFIAVGLGLSVLTVRETHHHATAEAVTHVSVRAGHGAGLGNREIFMVTSFRDKSLSAVSQAGMVNNLNDGLAWGLFPVLFATAGLGIERVGILTAVYPAVWGAGQLVTVLLGAGTAMVYPTLLAAIGDVAHPTWRARSVGIYRLWRDSGFAVGALLSGLIADAFGIPAAVAVIAALTAASGILVAIRMRGTDHETSA